MGSASPSALRLNNVRVVVEEGARLVVGMAVEEVETDTERDTETGDAEDEASAEGGQGRGQGQGSSSTIAITTLMLEGVAQQVRDSIYILRVANVSGIPELGILFARWIRRCETHSSRYMHGRLQES